MKGQVARYVTVLALAILVAGAGLGCEKQAMPAATDIVSGVTSALGKATTFTLTSFLSENYTVETSGSATLLTITWGERALVELSSSAAVLSANITETVGAPSAAGPGRTWEYYVYQGSRYYHPLAPRVYPVNPWIKTPVSDPASAVSGTVGQMTPALQLLQTAAQARVTGAEVVGGIKCYILDIVPTPEAASDWVLRQDRGGSGPSVYWWWTGYDRSREIYTKAYQQGRVTVWVDRATYRIVRTAVSLNFVVRPGNVTRLDMPGEQTAQTDPNDVGFDAIVTVFQGQYDFSGYGQRLSIIPPPEALGSPAR